MRVAGHRDERGPSWNPRIGAAARAAPSMSASPRAGRHHRLTVSAASRRRRLPALSAARPPPAGTAPEARPRPSRPHALKHRRTGSVPFDTRFGGGGPHGPPPPPPRGVAGGP